VTDHQRGRQKEHATMIIAQVSVTEEAQGFFDGVKEGVNDAWESALGFLPNVIGALVILFVGWLVAKFIQKVTVRVLERVGFDRLLEQSGLSGTMQRAGYTASSLVGQVVLWIVLLTVFLLAAEALGSETLTELLSDLISYLPRLAVVIAILIVTAALGRFLADLVAPWADENQVAWMAPATRFAVIGFGVFAALNTLDVASEIVDTTFLAILATAGVTVAVSYGIGGIKTAERHWERVFSGSSNRHRESS
jgi:hypothetical protein